MDWNWAMTDLEQKTTGLAGGVQRRTLLKALGVTGAVGAVAGLTGCMNSSAKTTPTRAAPPPSPSPSTATATATKTTMAAAPAADGKITAAGVARAVKALPDIMEKYRQEGGIPGLGVSVVYDGEVVYLGGKGPRVQGKPAEIDADTVFYLASVSKPISSTVIAAAITKKLSKASWNNTLASQLPGFTLSDPWVGRHVTVADMFSHRSGLPDHAGNLLEDLGFNRGQIIEKLRHYPLARFRDNYEYTNYGLTAGAEAIATAAKRSWETLADDMIFKPLGMADTSYAYAALRSRKNRVALHRLVDGKYVACPDADYEPQAPAGSASSSVRDMAKWVTMMLAGGKLGSTTIVDTEQLVQVWLPAMLKPGTTKIGEFAKFYGFGWNVNYDAATGVQMMSHSGAFGRGAATSVSLFPVEKLGIVALTNATPVGVAEAVSAEFVDLVRYGKSTQEDWLTVIGPYFEVEPTADQKKYEKPAANPKPARSLAAYIGAYRNSFYGPLTVSTRNDKLWFTAGPNGEQHALKHYSGDDFYFETTGEDASGLSGAVFEGYGSRVNSVTINAWNKFELGIFTH